MKARHLFAARPLARVASFSFAAILAGTVASESWAGDLGHQGPARVAVAPMPATEATAIATALAPIDPRQRARASRRRPRRRPIIATPAIRYTSPRSAGALESDLATMLSTKVRRGRWGVMVVSLTRGDTLYRVNAEETFQPASTMKLFTAAIALERFGPEYQLSTDVLRDGPLGPEGTVEGNLVLRGDGDPALSNRFLRGDADAPMELLAQFVAGAGVRRVRGDLIADASAFEERLIPEGWLPRYLQSGYAARVSALSLNENLVSVVASPGVGKGPAIVVLEPSSSTIPLRSTVRTVSGSSGGKVTVRRALDGSVEARGWIGSRSGPRAYLLVVEDPARFTAGAFRAALATQGITVDGEIRLAPTPASAVKVGSLPSPPLARMIAVMNRESINHYAELLFRGAARGRQRTEQGSAANGNALLQRFLGEQVGVTPGDVFAADGSGLSTLDRITPRAMIQLLAFAHAAPWSSAFHASLPVAGESELLRNRMRLTPAQGNLHAKTGTTNSVISLAGYVTAQDGEVLAFSFIYNGTDRGNARETIDAMGATLASFVRQ